MRNHRNPLVRLILVGLAVALGPIAPNRSCAEPAAKSDSQRLFEKVFGGAVILDASRLATVKAMKEGERAWFDTNGDGRADEVWFVDTVLRHPEALRPVLVRALDEDGDLEEGEEPDTDSDLYVADWKADGTPDVVLDYTDHDGDNDVDEMGMYFAGDTHSYFNEPTLRVWWGLDVGDDNLLWHDIAYTYDQTLCQFRTHFGGDELFVAFALPLSGDRWVPFFENPFLFYDRDGDGVTEEVLRISGIENEVEAIRWSFDADNDGTPESPRDFDCSITAWAPGAGWTPEGRGRGHSDVTFSGRESTYRSLRGFRAGPYLRRELAPEFASRITWERMMLTWDEIDRNVDGQRDDDENERWEGVIADGNPDFQQVGGPSCGQLNKRYELVLKPKGPIQVYSHPVDHRIHLRGADRAWMTVDADLDRKPDFRYEMRDTDSDGILDEWSLDLDGDGKAEDSWSANSIAPEDVEWSWGVLHSVVEGEIARSVPQLFALHERLEQALSIAAPSTPKDPVWAKLEAQMEIASASPVLARQLLSSDESLRFFLDMRKDVLIHLLKAAHADAEIWTEFTAARRRGDYVAMTQVLEREFQLTAPLADLGEFREGMLRQLAPKRVAWGQDWVPPNIGWESEKVCYRVYWGQFDFFGKKGDTLILPTMGPVSYHEETEWGIDALLVGKGPGCGGVTLYVNGEGFPVRSPEGKGDIVFTKRLVSESPDRMVIEHLATGVGSKDSPYTVRFLCSALAGRSDSPFEVVVTGGKPEDRLELGIGLSKLPQETLHLDSALGAFSVRGFQTPLIGWIDMGVAFPAESFQRMQSSEWENQVVLRIEKDKPITYHIECDWLRGKRFDCCPTGEDFFEEIRALAASLR